MLHRPFTWPPEWHWTTCKKNNWSWRAQIAQITEDLVNNFSGESVPDYLTMETSGQTTIQIHGTNWHCTPDPDHPPVFERKLLYLRISFHSQKLQDCKQPPLEQVYIAPIKTETFLPLAILARCEKYQRPLPLSGSFYRGWNAPKVSTSRLRVCLIQYGSCQPIAGALESRTYPTNPLY